MEELITWFSVGALLIGALAGEWKGTSDVTNRSKTTISVCKDPATTQCDIIGASAQLNGYTENQATIQWRRGIIGACALAIIAPLFLQVRLSSRQTLLLILLTWVVLTSISGYNDYHMRSVAVNTIDDCLSRAIALADTTGTQNVCSPAYIDVASSRSRSRFRQ
jgi:hypothetical protein